MKKIDLREYQQECVDIINNLESGAYLVVLATGLGKSAIFTHIQRKGRVLILSHREELVHQPAQYYDCSFGVEQAKEVSHGEDVVSASVQSLVRRLDKFDPYDFDTIIIDESHHSVAPTYMKILDYFKPRLLLGFTATPNRRDKIGLSEVFDSIIYNHDIKWGIQNNYLSDIECRKVDVGYDLTGVHKRHGDFAPEELENAIDVARVNEAIGEVYNNYAVGKTLIFAAGVEHANNLAKIIPGAEVITGTTPNRGEILDRFEHGDLDCIVNCMILTEGVDLPCVETVLIARPTHNLSLYCQMVGRGTRLYPGKKKLNLIDCVGVSKLNICTAPMLFGIDPEVAARTMQDKGLLSDMEQRIDKTAQKIQFGKDFWRINAELVNIFEADGGYDLHGINFTAMANGGLVCSLGDKKSILIEPEDALGRTTLRHMNGDFTIESFADMKMQDALDEAYQLLISQYSSNAALWDKSMAEVWGSQPISERQAVLVMNLYKPAELANMEVDINTLSKYQASVLISRKVNTRRLRSAS